MFLEVMSLSDSAVLEVPAEAEVPVSESFQGEHAGATLTGEFRFHRDVASRFLEQKRCVVVYLPPGYADEPLRRYPVFYMHDGQNIFDATTAFGGQEWRVDETAETMIRAGEIEPMIIVGIYNTGEHRMFEYTPTFDKKQNAGGGAKQYGRFVVEELKPMIDETYRTLAGRNETAIGGSSLGGLVSLYLGVRYPYIFGRVAAISPSVWWDRRMILRPYRTLTAKLQQKIWLDSGDQEGRPALQNVRDLREILLSKGWSEGIDLGYLEADGHRHDEPSWAARMGAVLGFLFPKG